MLPKLDNTILSARGLGRATIRAGLESLYFSGAHALLRPFLGGMGAILTFHRVRPATSDDFCPNGRLEVRPEYLSDLIKVVRRSGFEIISLDEVHQRLTSGDVKKPFVALTFDDGYRDNFEYAWPVLKQHMAPFTVFVCSDFADGQGELWWMALESSIRKSDRLVVNIDGNDAILDCSSTVLKYQTFNLLYSWLRAQKCEAEIRETVREIARSAGVDLGEQCRASCMDWSEIDQLAQDELATIGAHTTNHLVLNKADAVTAQRAMFACQRRIEKALGKPTKHLAYPFGDRSAAGIREFGIAAGIGFATAVTTRRGVLFSEHSNHLTALPRIPINGNMQRTRHLEVFLSGVPTAIANKGRRLDVT